MEDREQIIKIIKNINSLLEPEKWDKGMIDAFILGYRFGFQEIQDKIKKLKDKTE